MRKTALTAAVLSLLSLADNYSPDLATLNGLIVENDPEGVAKFLDSHPDVKLQDAAATSLQALEASQRTVDYSANTSNFINSRAAEMQGAELRSRQEAAELLAAHGADFQAAFTARQNEIRKLKEPGSDNETSAAVMMEMAKFVGYLNHVPRLAVAETITNDCHPERLLPGPDKLLQSVQDLYASGKQTGEQRSIVHTVNQTCQVYLEIESHRQGSSHDITAARVYVAGDLNKKLSDRVDQELGLRPGSYTSPAN